MEAYDLIFDQSHTPSSEEICAYILEPGRSLWQEFCSFIEQHYKVAPKVSYSGCSGKPGWNVKYKKSGKSLCTLYPERQGFVTLLVVKLDLLPVVDALQEELDTELLQLVKKATPFNGTLWLMVPVYRQAMLESVKELLLLKQHAKPGKYHRT